jgi:hypothetical protein
MRRGSTRNGSKRALLRVGVTGHRDIATRYRGHDEAIRRTIVHSLIGIREAALAARVEEALNCTPVLRLVSPLAEGADRIAADAGHELGYRLLAALPFSQAEYEHDFDAASRVEFRRLLARARAEDGVVELAGTRGDADAAYLAVGEYVVWNSDVMVAIWDRARLKHRGGTGAIVRLALESGLCVLWISPAAPDTARLLVGRSLAPGNVRPPDSVVEITSKLLERFPS